MIKDMDMNMDIKLQGVLLDFDGTLTKPFFDWPAMKAEMGFEEDLLILDYIATLKEPERSRIQTILHRHEAEAAAAAELNDGVSELLSYLRQKGLAMGLVTNNRKVNVDQVLTRFNLQFETVIARDIGFWKPDPRHVLVGAEALRVPPQAIAFIGDGRFDMEAGRAAGMKTIYLKSGGWGMEECAHLCDHVIEDLQQAIPLLAAMG